MQTIAKESLLFGDGFSKSSFVDLPVTGRTWHLMKLNHGNGQTVDDILTILAQIQAAQDHLTDQVDGLHQIPTPTIKPALSGFTWK